MYVAITDCIRAYNQRLKPGEEPMTQARLAAAIGATQSTVSRWAQGSRPLTVERLAKIAEVLHCKPEDLLRPYNDTPS